MDNESMELTNTEQQACCGSECGLPEATEMETNAAGGSVATVSLATSEYYIIMERLALMIYSFCFISLCFVAVVYSMGVYVHHHCVKANQKLSKDFHNKRLCES